MRNRISQKVIASLVTATVAGFMAMSIMPEIRCTTDRCVAAEGHSCYAGGQVLHGYKMKIGFDG